MALQTSGPISLNNVNQELGNAAPYTQVISLNDTAVRTLFAIASGAISMSDGYGKSSIPPYQFINGTGEGGDQEVCGTDSTWSTTLQIAGTLPITWQLLMYANGCTGEYVLQTGSSGGTGYNANYQFTVNNAAASGNGTYTGGSVKYKAAHYKVKVFAGQGSQVLTSGAYHVTYGNCSQGCDAPEGEQCTCTDICCNSYDCSGDCIVGYGCGDCTEEQINDWFANPGACFPSGCGQNCVCTCSTGYYDIFDPVYAPQGTCN